MHYSDRKKQPFRQVGTAAEKEGLRMAANKKIKRVRLERTEGFLMLCLM